MAAFLLLRSSLLRSVHYPPAHIRRYCSTSSSIDPKSLFDTLSLSGDSNGRPILSGDLLDSTAAVLDQFSRSKWVRDQSLAFYLPYSHFPSFAARFRRFFLSGCPPSAASEILSLAPSTSSPSKSALYRKILFPLFTEFCLSRHAADIRALRPLADAADLTNPHLWYPYARAMKRKIVYHCGPTNSGKTFSALSAFTKAKRGVYCSPLRLLAMEVFDKVNAMGVYCSLLTGQEKKDLPFSNHTACTIEMVSTDKVYDVAVIDEVQMMADPVRGYAWTRAFLGLKADEVHLCGDPSVLKIIRRICSATGDEFVLCDYQRFKPLVVEAKTLKGDLKNVRSGDCIVTFSRREIFEVKLAVEKTTKHKCCVIYGALPPETRRHQAGLFNEQNNEYDILVASDAVGMGLNLNIRRVVFYSLEKYNGDKMVRVAPSQVKQIAGRAGRRGSVYPDGLVTTYLEDDLDYLIKCLQQPFEEASKAGLFPCFEQVEKFAKQFPDLIFSELLDKLRDECRLDGSYFFCNIDGVKKVANMLERVEGLSLFDRYTFAFAPVNIRDPKAMHHLWRFATHFSEKRPVGIAMGVPKRTAKNDAELLALESKHQVVSLYLWLSNQFQEENFPYVQKAETMAANISELLEKSLAVACWKPESRHQAKTKEVEDESKEGNEDLKADPEEVSDKAQTPVESFEM